MTNKSIICSPAELDTNNFVISELFSEGVMPMAFINHKNMGKLMSIITKSIQITSYGIPSLRSDKGGFCQNDGERQYIIIPLDPDQSGCVELKDALSRIDSYIGSDEVKKMLFGPKKWDKYTYKPIVRSKGIHYDDDDDDDDSEEDYPKKTTQDLPPYCKVKLVVENNNNKTIVKCNGKKVSTNTITDITQYVKYKCMAIFTIRIQKIWALKCPTNSYNKIWYGTGLCMEKISVGKNQYEFVDYGVPIYNMDGLRKVYKKYIDENKKPIKRHVMIEI